MRGKNFTSKKYLAGLGEMFPAETSKEITRMYKTFIK